MNNDLKNESNPGTDKFDLGYIECFYSRLFNPIKHKVKNVLEIGVYAGKSLELWRNFFLNAEIIGVDINPCNNLIKLYNERIKTYIANGYDKAFVSSFKSTKFDIIIDDGPHTFESMEKFLTLYLPLLADEGLLIVEDIINISWTPKLLKFIDETKFEVEVINMAQKQKTVPLLNKWKNGLDVIVVKKIQN